MSTVYELSQYLLAWFFIAMLLGVVGCGFYIPYLVVRYLFLRAAGQSSNDAITHMTKWKLLPEDVRTEVIPLKVPVYVEKPKPKPKLKPVPVDIYAEALKPDPVDTVVKGAQVRNGARKPHKKKVHLDECMTPAHKEEFDEQGYDVTHARDVGLAGASDERNLAYAHATYRVLVSYDTDFLILHHKGLPHAGILKLPYPAHPKGVVDLVRETWG